jgi:glycopeptide antibiotics resistance protein
MRRVVVPPNWFDSLFGPPVLPIRIDTFSPLVLAALPLPLFYLRRKGKSIGYMLCFSVFFFYSWVVVSYTILDSFPHSLEHLEMIREADWSANVNLIPSLATGTFNVRSRQTYGNFLLGIPFGLGVPFLIRSTHRRVLLLALALAAGIESAQLLIGYLICQGPYRVIDIDDVLLVFTGTLSGYGALWAVARGYQRLAKGIVARFPVWDHVHLVLLRVAARPAHTLQRESHPPSAGSQNEQHHEHLSSAPEEENTNGA